jgi:hypothetical protein
MANKSGNMQTIKLGWDKPLDVDWDFHIPALRREIKLTAPGRSGALAQAFDAPGAVVFDEAAMLIDITVGPEQKAARYANIQEHGGIIPPFNLLTQGKPGHKRAMVAWIGGARRFFTRRGPILILGSHYVENAVHSWWRNLMRSVTPVVAWAGAGPGGGGARWASGHYSAGAERLSNPQGRVST